MTRDMPVSVIGGLLFMACDLIPRAIRFRLGECYSLACKKRSLAKNGFANAAHVSLGRFALLSYASKKSRLCCRNSSGY